MMAAPQRELVALDHHKLAMHPIGRINPPCIRITRFVPPRWPAAAVQNSAVATPPRLRQRARRQLRPGKPSSDLRQKRMFRPGGTSASAADRTRAFLAVVVAGLFAAAEVAWPRPSSGPPPRAIWAERSA